MIRRYSAFASAGNECSLLVVFNGSIRYVSQREVRRVARCNRPGCFNHIAVRIEFACEAFPALNRAVRAILNSLVAALLNRIIRLFSSGLSVPLYLIYLSAFSRPGASALR